MNQLLVEQKVSTTHSAQGATFASSTSSFRRPVCGFPASKTRSLCNAIKRVPICREGLDPRFPVRNALMVGWLQGTNPASSSCVSPVATSSLVIFWKSIHHYYIRIELAQYLCNENTYYNRDMKTLQERLIWARAQKAERDGADFTQQDLANRAGVTQGSIAHLESGRTKTSRSLTKISAALGVSTEWLADGKGDPFAPSTTSASVADLLPGAMRVIGVDPDHPSRTQIIKIREFKLSAGITGFQVEIDHRDGGIWDVPTRWLQKKGFNPRDLVAVEVKGESMEPNLYEGDLVVINTADTNLVNGEVYAVNYEGEAVIKRLIREGGQWYLSSDNALPKYARRLCKGRECIIVGKVVRRETEQV